jgi:[CysO sulfur-carrier protein]-S-L-cysteine hydrolase
MRISRELLDELVAHAREEAPNECCGVVAVEPGRSPRSAHSPRGRGGAGAFDDAAPPRAARLHRAVNTAASPLRFEVDGRELLRMIEAIEQDGCELGAIYHSHTRTAPYPSQTDINFAANWPGVEWIIVGLAGEESPLVRSYLISDGEVAEVTIEETAA